MLLLRKHTHHKHSRLPA